MFTHLYQYTFTALFALLVGACSTGTSEVSILLTDAPGDVEAAVITIDQIYLAGEPAPEGPASYDPDADDANVILRDRSFTVDLLDLTNTAHLLVDDYVVPSGHYEQLRFVMSGAAIAKERDGRTVVWSTPGYTFRPRGEHVGELIIPSWWSSGFKVKLPDDGLTVDGDQRILLVDFDIAESVGQENGAGDLVMRPVIEAVDVDVSAAIDLHVSIANLDPTLLDGATAILHDAEGNLEAKEVMNVRNETTAHVLFQWLRPSEGPFYLTFDSDEENLELRTTPTQPIEIHVESGETVTRAVTITGAVLVTQ